MSAQLLERLVGPGGDFEISSDSWPCGGKQVTGRCFVGPCRPTTLREFAIRQFGKYRADEFLVYEDERYTFGRCWSLIQSLATALVRDFDIRSGDRVAISMRNYPEWALGFLAATCVGAVVVPLNSLWSPDELAYGLEDSGAKCLLCDEERLRRAASSLERLGIRAILVDRDSVGNGKRAEQESIAARLRVPNFRTVVERHPSASLPSVSSPGHDDPAVIMYTSGTTSKPKGVVLTQRGVCSQLTMALLAARIDEESGIEKTEQPCVILPVPLFHVTASHHIFLQSLCSGRKMVMMYRWDPKRALEHIERERPQGWTGVPTMVQDMMNHPDFDKFDTSSLRAIGGGGAPTPKSQVGRVGAKFKGGSASQGYGLTETNGAVCGISGEEYVARPSSCGLPYPIVEVCVVDPESAEGTQLPSGHRGELLIRSPLVMSHYFNKPEKTAEAIISLPSNGHGWFRTGDIAMLDDEGYVYIVDRKKDIIIRGGENISCSEVETAFYEDDAVFECAAFNLKDPRLGERVGLAVVLKSSFVSEDVVKNERVATELINAMRARQGLAAFKIPLASDVFFFQDSLPHV